MDVSVFGLGYVGVVSAGCLSTDGHNVIGVDTNLSKVDLVNSGLAPIIEQDIGEMVGASVRAGRLSATTSVHDAVHGSDVSLICVGTPSQLNGNLDLCYVSRVCEEIGHALRDKDRYHVVVVRSTMLPGSMRNVVIPTLEAAAGGKKAGVDFGVCVNPEFMREGTAVADYHRPPKTVIGEMDERSGQVLVTLYRGLDAPLIRTSLEVAEMVKYADNNWHALKVAFANEIGSICRSTGIDGGQLMDIFCKDEKLNLSSYYMKPGMAFGGSCLPKDVRALTFKARTLDLEIPLLNAIIPSNRKHLDRAIAMITSKGKRRVGVLGFAFKSGTDDLRESPMVDVIEYLLGKGYELRLYDDSVNLAALTGTNRDLFLNRIPHIAHLMVDSIEEVMAFAETVVIGNADPEFKTAVASASSEQMVVDFVRATDYRGAENYDGICW